MIGYFNPLRRKIGVVMLVVACVFAAGWVRSGRITDVVWIQSKSIQHVWTSRHYRISLEKKEFSGFQTSGPWITFRSDEQDILWAEPMQTGLNKSERTVLWILPYWSIVLPLTLISTGLLLSKSKQPKQTTEPGI